MPTSRQHQPESPGDVLIVETARSPFGRPGSQLSEWHPAAMASFVAADLVERAGVEPALIDSLTLGCTSQIGAQAMNVARSTALGAGLSERTSAVSLDAGHTSGLEAVRFAATTLKIGSLAIAGGSEHMSRVPLGLATLDDRYGEAYGPAVVDRFKAVGGLQPPGVVAERIAARLQLEVADLEAYAMETRRRFEISQKEGLFDGEVVCWPTSGAQSCLRDETAAAPTRSELRTLTPCFGAGGLLTSAMVAPPADGAALLLLAHRATAERHGMRGRAKILAATSTAVNPVDGSVAAVEATTSLLQQTGLRIGDVNVFEIHEAFACIPLAWSRAFSVDVERCNVDGGALSAGDPVGAGAAALLVAALRQLERNMQRYALVVTDGASGHASAAIIERCA